MIGIAIANSVGLGAVKNSNPKIDGVSGYPFYWSNISSPGVFFNSSYALPLYVGTYLNAVTYGVQNETTIFFQWYANNVEVLSGYDEYAYLIQDSDLGKTIKVKVTVSNGVLSDSKEYTFPQTVNNFHEFVYDIYLTNSPSNIYTLDPYISSSIVKCLTPIDQDSLLDKLIQMDNISA
jgi:hypothetical protein